MMGSAPWTKEQFQTKGVDALLETAVRQPNLHLIFLWRGLLYEEMIAKVTAFNLQDRVTILNQQVDVNDVLARAHASIVLASDNNLIKAYPHSLLESLVAGKPVLVSDCVPLADYATQNGCGIAIPRVTTDSILDALATLTANYTEMSQNARRVGSHDFGLAQFIEKYHTLYHTISPTT